MNLNKNGAVKRMETQLLEGCAMRALEISLMSGHVHKWSNDVGEIIAYRKIPGRKPGEEISITNCGDSERPDWQYTISDDGRELCCNRHFSTPENAHAGALEWLDMAGPMRPMTLRKWKRSSGYPAYSVDGLSSRVEVRIVEFGPHNCQFLVTTKGREYGQWSTSWPSPNDALAAYRRSVVN
jgi:hypothetical protein